MTPNIAHGVCRARPNVPVAKKVDRLWVGICTVIKDHHAFLEFVREVPDCRGAMASAPGHYHALWDLLRLRARSLPNLSVRGFVPYKDSDALCLPAQLLVCTSRSEGFPNFFLQAWEHEAPVVSPHIDPNRIIKTKRLGRVTSATAGLADGVRDIPADEPGRRCMGTAGRRYVLETLSPFVVVARYLKYWPIGDFCG